MLQAKIGQIYYIHPWSSPRSPDQDSLYKLLMEEFEHGVVRLEMTDPRKDWALAASAAVTKSVDEHGMESE
jgi:hypothetical protein